MNERDFRRHIKSLGYAEPEVLALGPNTSGPMHTHNASSIALVLSGSVTIVLESKSVLNQPGELCEVPAGVLHDERPGPEGVTVLIAWK